LAGPGGNGYHVFHRSGKFHADHVVVGVQAKRRPGKLFLQPARERSILGRQHHRGRFAARGFGCKRRSGKHGDALGQLDRSRFGQHISEHQAHAQMRRGFEPFRGTHKNHLGRYGRKSLRVHGAGMHRGQRADHHLPRRESCRHVVGYANSVGQTDACQIRAVFATTF
jgi:hypothetical protein